jgi:hypothetical protein
MGIEFKGFAHLGWTIVDAGEGIDGAAVQDVGEPVEFVVLGIVDGVAGEYHEVNGRVPPVENVDCPDSAVEQLATEALLRSPCKGIEVRQGGEPRGRFLIDYLRIGDVGDSCDEFEAIAGYVGVLVGQWDGCTNAAPGGQEAGCDAGCKKRRGAPADGYENWLS